jgi:hypothetical protein
MSGWAAFVLGMFLVAAAVLHGGIWAAGNDFVVNRYTGAYEFVPSDEDDAALRTPAHHRTRVCLDALGGRG